MVCLPPCVCGSVNISNGTRALVFLDEPSSGQQGWVRLLPCMCGSVLPSAP